MKTVLWCLAVFCGLLLAGAVTAPFLIDEEARKNAISAELEEQLDAQVDITGEVSLSLLPRPQLRLGEVRIHSEAGNAAPVSHLEIAYAELDISLGALLSGNSAFERVHLRHPRLFLTSQEEGTANRLPGLADAWLSKLEGLRPLRLEISDGETLFLGAQENPSVLAEAIALSVRVPESGTPLRFEGSGKLQDKTHRFSLAIGRSGPEQQRAFDLSWSSPQYGTAQARLRGNLTLSEDRHQLTGQLTAQVDNLESAFPGTPEGRSALPFSLETEISSNFEDLQADIGQLRLGGMDASGEAQLRFARIPAFDLRLEAQQLDLSSWRKRLEGRGQDLLVAALGRQLDGRLRLRAESAGFMGERVQDLRLDATLAPGAALVERLELSAPGGSNLHLTGTLSPEAQTLDFDGNLEGETGNLRDFLTWLGMETDHIPGERLRRASLSTGLQYSEQLLQFTNLELALDVSRLSGGIAIALRERPGVGIGLEVDRLNLDGYLPQDSDTPDGKIARLRQDLAALGSLLNRFDANLNLHAGRLTYLGEHLSDLQLTGQLQGGELTFETLRVGNFSGLSASFSGGMDNLEEVPQLSDTQFELEISQPQRLANTLGLPYSGYFGQLGALSANGILDGPLNELSINSDLALGDASLFFSARLASGSRGSRLSKGKIDLSGLTGQQLGNWLDLDADNPLRQLPELHVASDFSLREGTWQYDTRLDSGNARLHLEGTTEDIDIGYPVTSFRFKFTHPDNARLLPRLLGDGEESLPALMAEGQAEASPRAIELQESELSLNTEPLDVGGEWLFSGRRPEIKLALQGERLNLASLAPLLPAAYDTNASASENVPWLDAPLPFGFLLDYQGRLDLAVQHLETSRRSFEDLRLSAEFADNRLQIEELSAGLLEGRFSTTGSLLADSIGSYTAELKGELSGISANVLSSALFGPSRLEGTLDLPFRLSTEGDSLARMLRNLNGNGELSGHLRVPENTREPGMPTGTGDTAADSLFALLDYPADIAGDLQVQSGRLTSQTLQLRDSTRQIALKGMLADLPRRQIQATAELFEDGEGSPDAVMEITGPLGDPAFRWQKFEQSLSRSNPQNTGGSAPPERLETR